jgi:hypothetical protein
MRRGIHVIHALPHLIEQVLPEPPALLQQRLELGRLWIADERWHAPKATVGVTSAAVLSHIASPLISSCLSGRT